MKPWLAVVGIGADGWEGLGAAARARIAEARLLVGGERHLALIPPVKSTAEKLAWLRPLADTIPIIAGRRGQSVAVLASGDPLCYGVGALLARHFPAEEMIVLPSSSAFSLAAARLLWPLEECVTLSLHARALDQIRLYLAPQRRILALSTDGATPGQLARMLQRSGWGPSEMIVLEQLGGPDERCIVARAAEWSAARCDDLNIVALQCRAAPDAVLLSRRSGLPDNAFRHDGQLTKRAVRAATLAQLSPLPGQLLWDIGAGSGSVAIEWLRADDRMRAIAIERDAARAALITANAAALGVSQLELRLGAAPEALTGLPAPDAVFIGGGVSDDRIWDTAWQSLKPGGRLVANAVTLGGEAALLRRHAAHGGELTRIAVAQAEAEHGFWRPAMPVTQLALSKPR